MIIRHCALILVLQILACCVAAQQLTTFGIQFKPMVPSAFFNGPR
jgi:hypothetical protein